MELVIYFKNKKKEPRHPSDVLFFVLPWLWLKYTTNIGYDILLSVLTDPQNHNLLDSIHKLKRVFTGICK